MHARIKTMSKSVRRLYEQFKPEDYLLELKPNREKMTFSGTVTIKGKKTGRPSQRLTFHQKDLKITSAIITKHDKKGDQECVTERINSQKTYDEVRLHSAEMLYPGNYTVTLEFSGKITRPMNGIYPCYFEQDGKQNMLIATQFESHHAREAFPCIDEPEAKATFDLTILTPKDEPVIANTPVKSQVIDGKNWLTTFETTPKMSTYLLAFVYGDMAYLEAKTKSNVVVRTYATPENVKHTQFALDVAVKCLDYYDEYFGIPYPLEKCDFIALPDFASGAMENWGCITFREATLLVDPENTSLPTKQYVAMVVAHELAHQWFGNLVTMRWWTDLWLNEGFASWIEYLATDYIFPEWNMWTQFVVDEQQQALRLDALENTHAIEVPINHPDEIRTIFDAISYAKGSSIIHMLEQYLGHDTFRDGLRLYLKKHAYGNTDTVDLWAALEEVSKRPVKQFMHAWTSLPGYPILQATVADGKLSTVQKRFLLNPAAKLDAAVWPLPLLPSGSATLTADVQDGETYEAVAALPEDFMLNSGRSGFYRIAYNPEHVDKLIIAIKAGKVNEIDRLGLLSDAFEAAKTGATSTVSALKLLEAYIDEESTVVWDIIAGGIGSIRAVMDDDELRESMKPFIRKLIAKQHARLGWDDKPTDSYFDKLLRLTILGLASVADESSVVDKALKIFKNIQTPSDVTPDLRGVVYGTAARHGATPEFEKMLALHNSSKSSEDRVTFAAALTNFEQPELIERALGFITTDTVRLQDTSYWMVYSFMNRHAKQLTWEWLKREWKWLEDNLGSDLAFSRTPLYAARAFSDETFVDDYKEFFTSKMSPTLDRTYKQGLETIEWQSAWRKRDLAAIKAYFK
jgi:aminopeptidase N